MKKVLSIIGIGALTIFSFYYTNKLVDIVKEKDPIMIEINDNKEEHTINAIDAIINNDYIISGLNGLSVDKEKSYQQMKKLGSYNENLYIFIKEYPDISIAKRFDKFIIGGNRKQKKISIVFKIEDLFNINKLLYILGSTPSNFFIDGKLFEDNLLLLKEIVDKGHLLGNLGYEGKYNSSTIKYTNALIDKYMNISNDYCYVEDDDYNVLDLCKKLNMHTIKSNVISNTNSYSDMKNKLSNGGIYTLDTNNYTLKELKTIINYIKQKGFKIVLLEELLNEEY